MPSFYLSTWLNYYPVDLWISSESKELTEEGILTLNVKGVGQNTSRNVNLVRGARLAQ